MSAALWKKIQSVLGITADGVPGDQTANAVAAKFGLISQVPIFDSRSEANIATLVPGAQAKAREWLVRCRAEGINVKVICGLRTYAEQAELYAQGRTKPGSKVTNAMPGYSWHNFGVAWDFVVFDANGQPQWDSPEWHGIKRDARNLTTEHQRVASSSFDENCLNPVPFGTVP
jgi:peptidoglycan L-alanyl-D-glutamate endopeptidase CwlK